MENNNSSEPEFIYHYTKLEYAIDILKTKKLKLLDPSKWEDKVDCYFLEKYKDANNLKNLFAKCFTSNYAQYQHWKIYGSSADPNTNPGVRIKFSLNKLRSELRENFTLNKVTYLKEKDFKNNSNYGKDQLPFLKRRAYRDELEYRLIYGSSIDKNQEKPTEFYVGEDSIIGILLSPWILDHDLPGIQIQLFEVASASNISCIGSHTDIKRSTIIDSEKWRGFADKVVNRPALK